MLRKWNVTLVVSTFLLSIFGTFITRSGIISSVHSFAQSPVGTWFAGFLILSIVVTAYLVATRLNDLEAKASLESMVSREAAFLYNNVVLVGIAFSVLWGTLFPIITEAVRGEKITVGPPFFNAVNIPLGLTLLLLTGIGPLIAWRRASLGNLQRQLLVVSRIGRQRFQVLLRHRYNFMPGFGRAGQRSDYRVKSQDLVRKLAYLLESPLSQGAFAIGDIQAEWLQAAQMLFATAGDAQLAVRIDEAEHAQRPQATLWGQLAVGSQRRSFDRVQEIDRDRLHA